MKAKMDCDKIAKRLKLLETIIEAQLIEARNEVEQSWVTSGEMRQRLVKRGANVDSQYR